MKQASKARLPDSEEHEPGLNDVFRRAQKARTIFDTDDLPNLIMVEPSAGELPQVCFPPPNRYVSDVGSNTFENRNRDRSLDPLDIAVRRHVISLSRQPE